MGHFRFRRSFGPKFLKLNVSKTGFSVTGGVPGAHVNMDLSNRRKRVLVNTFSLPGTGLSYRTSAYGPERTGGSNGSVIFIIGLVILVLLFWLG